MAPLPEDLIPKPQSIDGAIASYSHAAKAHNDLLKEYRKQEEYLALLKKKLFGKSSEKMGTPPLDVEILSPPEAYIAKTIDEPKAPVAKPKGHGWGTIPDHLERVEIIVPPTPGEAEKLSQGLIRKIRDEISERLAMRPPVLYVKRFIRPVFGTVGGETPGTILPLNPLEIPIERGRADITILVYLMVSKFVDHLPLDRMRKMFLRHGIQMPTSTMSNWLRDLESMLLPIWQAMADSVRSADLVHADETTCRVVVDGKQGKTKTGYLWVYISGGHAVYDYSPTRSGDNPIRFLEGFSGILQTDGYSGYNGVCEKNKLTRAGCHAHARRKFMEALEYYPKAGEIIAAYQELFEVESTCDKENDSASIRLAARLERSAPIIQRMRDFFDRERKSVLPKDRFGEAIGYALSQWEPLTAFLKDGRIPLTNNISERAMRPAVMGRNNYLFFGNAEAAQRGAIFYSITHSCRELDVNPMEYLEDVLSKLHCHPQSRIGELTPAGWVAKRAESVAPIT